MNGIGLQKTIEVTRKTIQKIGKIMWMNSKREISEDKGISLASYHTKLIRIIVGCTTEEQLRTAEVCLRNYERLMQNSYLYPTLTKQEYNERSNRLHSLIKIKRKAFLDF